MKQEDVLASLDDVAGDTDAEKLAYLCEFYDSMTTMLMDYDVWKYIGDEPSNAAEYIALHGLPTLQYSQFRQRSGT